MPQYEHVALAAQHFAIDGALQLQTAPGFGRLAGAQLGEQRPVVDDPFDQYLDLAAALLAAEQTGRDHARIVEYDQVAGIDVIDQLGEMMIAEPSQRRLQHHQARTGTLGQGFLRDQFLGQPVIEIAQAHGRVARKDGV